jgi:hypothetical protein
MTASELPGRTVDMPTLSLNAAAARARIAPKTLKAWHAAGLVSAASIGRRGVTWLFDETTLDRELRGLPRCSYRRVDEAGGLTVRCDRPVAEPGAACQRHRIALAAATEDEAARKARIDKSAATQRKHEDGVHYCEAEGCRNELREQNGWRLEQRRRQLARSREDGDARLLCGSCAAKRRHEERPIYGEAKSKAEAACAIVGLDRVAAVLPREYRRSPGAVRLHVEAGGLVTMREGWVHVVLKDEIPPYLDWLARHPSGRLRRFNITSPERARQRAAWHQSRHKSTAEFGRLAGLLSPDNPVGRPRLRRQDGTRLRPEEEQAIGELLRDGWSQQRIANKFRVSRDQIKRYAAALKKLGETPLLAA